MHFVTVYLIKLKVGVSVDKTWLPDFSLVVYFFGGLFIKKIPLIIMKYSQFCILLRIIFFRTMSIDHI